MWYIIYFTYNQKKEVYGDDLVDCLLQLSNDEINAIKAVRQK